jgi:hypothetical protein
VVKLGGLRYIEQDMSRYTGDTLLETPISPLRFAPVEMTIQACLVQDDGFDSRTSYAGHSGLLLL